VVLSAVVIFWDVTSCSRLKVNWRFVGTCRLHFRFEKVSFPPSLMLVSFLAYFIRCWRWRRHVPPKCRLLSTDKWCYVPKVRKKFNFDIIFQSNQKSSESLYLAEIRYVCLSCLLHVSSNLPFQFNPSHSISYSTEHETSKFFIFFIFVLLLIKYVKILSTDTAFCLFSLEWATRLHNQSINQSPWPESACELYRPSDLRLSAKLMPTFADRGCNVISVTDPYGRNLGFLDRTRLHTRIKQLLKLQFCIINP
jgi:hypothetical protein